MICRTPTCRTAARVVLAWLSALAFACSSTTPPPDAPATDATEPGAAGQPAATPPTTDEGKGGAEGDAQPPPPSDTEGEPPDEPASSPAEE